MQFKIPENLPDVPIVAINRYPFFPGFIKKVDVCFLFEFLLIFYKILAQTE
jgi:hypothetical protein